MQVYVWLVWVPDVGVPRSWCERPGLIDDYDIRRQEVGHKTEQRLDEA